MGNLLGKNGKKFGILAAFVIGLFLGFRYLLPLAGPFVMALLVVHLTWPGLRRWQKRLHIRRELLLAGLLILLTALLVALIWGILQWLLLYLPQLGRSLTTLEEQMTGWLHGCCSFLEENFGIDGVHVEKLVIERMEIFAQNLEVDVWPSAARQSFVYVKKAAGAAAFLGIGFIASLLLCRDYEALLERIGQNPQLEILWKFLEKTVGMITGYIKAQAIILCVITIIAIVGMWIGRVKGALWLGVLAGLLDALPFIGTGIVLLPTLLWQLLTKNIMGAVCVGVSYVLCIVARELLEPRLLGKQLGVNPVLMLFSVYAGAKVFGLSGLFLGPLYVVLLCEGGRYLLKNWPVK